MSSTKEILLCKAHRAFDYPNANWIYYQEWNRAIFLHWKVSLEVLQQWVPPQFNIDCFEGEAYISLVAFTMEKIRPRYLPSLKFISDFDEINIRTYIDNDNKKGVYFLNIEAGKLLSSLIAKGISGLPYEKSNIKRTENKFKSKHPKKPLKLDIEYAINESINVKTELDTWLTERYCLYLEKGQQLYRYDIHHKPWDLQNLSILCLELDYSFGNFRLNYPPDMLHYSAGVQVLAWGKEKI